MTMFKSASALVMALSLGTSATATTTNNCLSEAEGTAVFAAMLPDLIDGLRDKCAAHLPANSYLVKNGDALIAQFKVQADRQWPAAKLAFGRIAGQEEMTDKLPDEFFRPMVGAMVGAELVKDLKVEDCHGASRVVENLAPLPPENVAGLISAILVLAEDEKDSDDSFQICKA